MLVRSTTSGTTLVRVGVMCVASPGHLRCCALALFTRHLIQELEHVADVEKRLAARRARRQQINDPHAFAHVPITHCLFAIGDPSPRQLPPQRGKPIPPQGKTAPRSPPWVSAPEEWPFQTRTTGNQR